MSSPVLPATRARLIASAMNELAPRAVLALPSRSRVCSTSGVLPGSSTVAISGWYPRTLV